MDYEKAYKELVNAVRVVVDGNPQLCKIDKSLGQLKDLLPNPVRNDERIRVRLIEYFESQADHYYFLGFTKDEILNWLKNESIEEKWHRFFDEIPDDIGDYEQTRLWIKSHLALINSVKDLDAYRKAFAWLERQKREWGADEDSMFSSIYTDVRNARKITVNSLSGDLKKQEEKRMNDVLDFLVRMKNCYHRLGKVDKEMLGYVMDAIRCADDHYFFERTDYSATDIKSWLLKNLSL